MAGTSFLLHEAPLSLSLLFMPATEPLASFWW
jgi:hypothetical protein